MQRQNVVSLAWMLEGRREFMCCVYAIKMLGVSKELMVVYIGKWGWVPCLRRTMNYFVEKIEKGKDKSWVWGLQFKWLGNLLINGGD